MVVESWTRHMKVYAQEVWQSALSGNPTDCVHAVVQLLLCAGLIFGRSVNTLGATRSFLCSACMATPPPPSPGVAVAASTPSLGICTVVYAARPMVVCCTAWQLQATCALAHLHFGLHCFVVCNAWQLPARQALTL